MYPMFVIEWMEHEREIFFAHGQFVSTKIREGVTHVQREWRNKSLLLL